MLYLRKFASKLKEFYIEIGYGFLCNDDKTHINRIMEPSDIKILNNNFSR